MRGRPWLAILALPALGACGNWQRVDPPAPAGQSVEVWAGGEVWRLDSVRYSADSLFAVAERQGCRRAACPVALALAEVDSVRTWRARNHGGTSFAVGFVLGFLGVLGLLGGAALI
ncbi:MAG: hypothetical protein AB7I33_02045 [Gemmatimonadales bacterium]